MSHPLTIITGAVLACITLGWFGPTVLDSAPAPRTYASYGYTPDAAPMTVSASHLADQRACQHEHGPNAIALQLPDGQHRCADKHGRRLAVRSAITAQH